MIEYRFFDLSYITYNDALVAKFNKSAPSTFRPRRFNWALKLR